MEPQQFQRAYCYLEARKSSNNTGVLVDSMLVWLLLKFIENAEHGNVTWRNDPKSIKWECNHSPTNSNEQSTARSDWSVYHWQHHTNQQIWKTWLKSGLNSSWELYVFQLNSPKRVKPSGYRHEIPMNPMCTRPEKPQDPRAGAGAAAPRSFQSDVDGGHHKVLTK